MLVVASGGAASTVEGAGPSDRRPDRPVVQVTSGTAAGAAGGRRGRDRGVDGGAGTDPAGRWCSRCDRPAGEAAGTRQARRTGLTAGVTLGMGAVCAAGSAAVVALQGTQAQRLACAAFFVLAALATAFPLRTSRVGGRLRSAASPVFAAAAGFTAGYSDETGGLLLGLAVAALCATGAAAVARAWLEPGGGGADRRRARRGRHAQRVDAGAAAPRVVDHLPAGHRLRRRRGRRPAAALPRGRRAGRGAAGPRPAAEHRLVGARAAPGRQAQAGDRATRGCRGRGARAASDS